MCTVDKIFNLINDNIVDGEKSKARKYLFYFSTYLKYMLNVIFFFLNLSILLNNSFTTKEVVSSKKRSRYNYFACCFIAFSHRSSNPVIPRVILPPADNFDIF